MGWAPVCVFVCVCVWTQPGQRSHGGSALLAPAHVRCIWPLPRQLALVGCQGCPAGPSPLAMPDRPPRPLSPLPGLQSINVLTGSASTGVSVQQIIQLGMFSIVTYAVELLLEYGFAKMIATILVQIVQGEGGRGGKGARGAVLRVCCKAGTPPAGPWPAPTPGPCPRPAGSLGFFIFRGRTTAYFFWNDVLYGGWAQGGGPARKGPALARLCSLLAARHRAALARLRAAAGRPSRAPARHALAPSRLTRRRRQVHPHRARLRHQAQLLCQGVHVVRALPPVLRRRAAATGHPAAARRLLGEKGGQDAGAARAGAPGLASRARHASLHRPRQLRSRCPPPGLAAWRRRPKGGSATSCTSADVTCRLSPSTILHSHPACLAPCPTLCSPTPPLPGPPGWCRWPSSGRPSGSTPRPSSWWGQGAGVPVAPG